MATQEITNIIIASSVILLVFGIFLFSIMLLYNRRKSEYREGLQIQKESFQKEILLAQLEIKEQTLQNISQEIHDNIGQSLSLAKLNLNTFNITKPEQALTKLESTRDLVTKAIHDLRNLSKSLNTDSILNTGLKAAIEHELIILEKSESFETSLVMEGNIIRFDPKKELILFRIFQEALNNIIKHAQATLISLQLRFEDERLVLVIADNGTGFELGEKFEGSGIRNMKNRASLIGADFDIETGTEGTRIQITMSIAES